MKDHFFVVLRLLGRRFIFIFSVRKCQTAIGVFEATTETVPLTGIVESKSGRESERVRVRQ